VSGLVAAALLWTAAAYRPGQAVDGFGRAAVGCTTTLEFIDVGTFYVFEETSDTTSAGCVPAPTADAEFSLALLDDGRPLALRSDDSLRYDTDGRVGRSVARVEIMSPGRYDLVVGGPDVSVVAAVGRDPLDDVDGLRRIGVVVGVAGLLVGLLSVLVVRRGRRHAEELAAVGGPQARGGPGQALAPWGPPDARTRVDPPPPAE